MRNHKFNPVKQKSNRSNLQELTNIYYQLRAGGTGTTTTTTGGTTTVVATYAAMLAQTPATGDLTYVVDASGDATVDSGAALYAYDGGTWQKIAEYETIEGLLLDFQGSHDYLANEPITAVSPTTGRVTLYRRTAAGTSGAAFNAVEEASWTPIANYPTGVVFMDDTTVSPATAGFPTPVEILSFLGTSNKDVFVYYTGTDTASDPVVKTYYVDVNGTVTELGADTTHSQVIDNLTPTATNTIPNLSFAPRDNAKVEFYLNGVRDYLGGLVATGTSVSAATWNGLYGFDILTTDEVTAVYFR